jgi:hypothetical protein
LKIEKLTTTRVSVGAEGVRLTDGALQAVRRTSAIPTSRAIARAVRIVRFLSVGVSNERLTTL